MRRSIFSIYEAFAETVRFILEKALFAAETPPRPLITHEGDYASEHYQEER